MADAAHIGGRLAEGTHFLPIRVYFEDTDHSGAVYHAGYLRFMERGRSEFVRAIGVSQTDLARGAHGEALTFVVRHIDIDFHRAARFEDLIEVETKLARLAGARAVLRQIIRRRDELLTEAEVTIVLVNADGKVRRLPQWVRQRLDAAGAE